MKRSEAAKEEFNSLFFTFLVLLALAVADIVIAAALDFSSYPIQKIICYTIFLPIILFAVYIQKLTYIARNRMEVLQKLEAGNPDVPKNLRELFSAYTQKDILYRVLQADCERTRIAHAATLNVLEQMIDEQNKQ